MQNIPLGTLWSGVVMRANGAANLVCICGCVLAISAGPAPRRNARAVEATQVVSNEANGEALDSQRTGKPARGESRSINTDVFPSMKTSGNDNRMQAEPGRELPFAHPGKAPEMRRPERHFWRHFSPRLQPPNGKTDGKIYPA